MLPEAEPPSLLPPTPLAVHRSAVDEHVVADRVPSGRSRADGIATHQGSGESAVHDDDIVSGIPPARLSSHDRSDKSILHFAELAAADDDDVADRVALAVDIPPNDKPFNGTTVDDDAVSACTADAVIDVAAVDRVCGGVVKVNRIEVRVAESGLGSADAVDRSARDDCLVAGRGSGCAVRAHDPTGGATRQGSRIADDIAAVAGSAVEVIGGVAARHQDAVADGIAGGVCAVATRQSSRRK